MNGATITIDATAGISLDAAAASNFTTSVGALTLDANGGIILKDNNASATNTITINGSSLIGNVASNIQIVNSVLASTEEAAASYADLHERESNLNKMQNYEIKRVRVHTCSLDHPHALKNYQSRGMQIYRRDTIFRNLI